MPTAIVWLFTLLALTFRDPDDVLRPGARGWAVMMLAVAMLVVGYISRAYTGSCGPHHHARRESARCRTADARSGRAPREAGREADRRAAFRLDAEFGALLERAARENLPPKDIKAAIKTWRPDRHRT